MSNVHTLFNSVSTEQNSVDKSYTVSSLALIPELSIRASVRALKQKQLAKEMFELFPMTHHIMVKLAGFITREYPDATLRPVMDGVLQKMLTLFTESRGGGKIQALIPQFYGIVLDSVDEISAYLVQGTTASGDKETWEPLSEPIVNWVRRENIVELQWIKHDWFGHEVEQEERRWLRYLMASKLLSFSEISMLNETGVING